MSDQTADRRQSIRAALHSDAMESGTAAQDEEFISWMDEWARGHITEEDVRRHLDERYDEGCKQ